MEVDEILCSAILARLLKLQVKSNSLVFIYQTQARKKIEGSVVNLFNYIKKLYLDTNCLLEANCYLFLFTASNPSGVVIYRSGYGF